MKAENQNRVVVAPPDDEYVLEDQVGFLLRCAHQRASAIFQEQLSEFQITPPQFSTLVKIRDFGSVSQNCLARATAMDIATMQGVVCRLADRGVIARNPDPDDKRRLVLTLTAKGRDLVSVIVDHGRVVARDTLAPLNDDDRALFLDLLTRLN